MAHVVTKPTAPFALAGGALEVHQVPSWQDNLIWLLVDKSSGRAAAVDGPMAEGVLAYCKHNGFELTTVLNTHTHADHIGINADLAGRGQLEGMQVVGPKLAAKSVPGITEPVTEGDEVELFGVKGRVMLTEGHMNGHVSYVFDDVLLCGDTMFGAGCGYLFDGPAATMHASLSRLVELDGATKVCCAHEYTEDNLRFAWSVEPDNDALAERIQRVWALRAEGGCSVPSTIAEERATNPFVRHMSPTLLSNVKAALPDRSYDTPADVFAATRALKDRKDYRARSDDELPLMGLARA